MIYVFIIHKPCPNDLAARGMVYFFKVLPYGILILLNNSDELFGAPLTFTPGAQAPLPPLTAQISFYINFSFANSLSTVLNSFLRILSIDSFLYWHGYYTYFKFWVFKTNTLYCLHVCCVCVWLIDELNLFVYYIVYTFCIKYKCEIKIWRFWFFVFQFQVRGSGMKPGLTVQDNHKPVFTNCLNYQPVVKEEQPTNTYVFTVSIYGLRSLIVFDTNLLSILCNNQFRDVQHLRLLSFTMSVEVVPFRIHKSGD